VEKSSRFLSQKRVPRDPAEAHAWLTQLASEMLQNQERPDEAALSPHLVKWFTDAVEAHSLEGQTKEKGPAPSLDIELGLKRRRGAPRGTKERRAIEIYYLREVERLSWYAIANRLEIELRTAQRIYEAGADAILRHLISRGISLQFGYDLKDGKPVINKREASTVRMIFEGVAQVGSAPAPKRALAALVRKLKAEGVTDKRGQPIDLYAVLNNRVYIGEVVHMGRRPGEYEAIIDRALWRKAHLVRRALARPTFAFQRVQKTTVIRRI
jgi:hypothetical protein